MENLIKLYVKKFKKEPGIIGMFWNDQEKLIENIINAIQTGKVYNELDLLTKEQRKAFEKGDIVF